MKCSTVFSGVSLLAFSSSAVASALLPRAAAAGAAALAKRAPIDDVYTIVSDLYTQVQTYTGSINATSASLDLLSPQSDKDAATASVGEQLNAITAAVQAAGAQVDAVAAANPDDTQVERRQLGGVTPEALASIVESLLLEISGALNGIIADLGLGPLLSFLTPLVGSLSGLLASLAVVVDNLLELVRALLDGLLIGLSIGLAGLIL